MVRVVVIRELFTPEPQVVEPDVADTRQVAGGVGGRRDADEDVGCPPAGVTSTRARPSTLSTAQFSPAPSRRKLSLVTA